MKEGLLTGVIVIDLTRVLAGPYCSMLLADMGATVYKLEQPGVGDDSRTMGPFINNKSVYYANFNRDKIGCTLNLKSEEGKALFRKMVEKADIVLENYRPGTMEKLGLGYEELRKIKPSLVYGSISGCGQTGPYAKKAGYDITAQAMSGLMSVTGWPDGEPTRVGAPVGDTMSGMTLTVGVLAALHHARETGEGERVDIALTDTLVSLLTNINQFYFAEGRVPGRIGNRYETVYPYGAFRAKDGNLIIAGGHDSMFPRLVHIMGKPELLSDPRFLRVRDRVKNHEEMKAIVEEWTSTRTVAEIIETLEAAGVPAAPVNTIDAVAADPQIAGARNMFPALEHPGMGTFRITNNPLKFSGCPADPLTPAPEMGQDNRELYCGFLGLTEKELEKLREDGVI